MNDHLRVLIIDDSETDAKLIAHALKSSDHTVETERVDDEEGMRNALAKSWDVVVCDWSMPKFSALAALTIAAQSGLDLPFIIVSGTIGEELAVEAMRAGASDYVLKDRLHRLLPAVEREVREAAARAAHRRAEQELHAQQARFQALIENSWDVVSLTNREGKLVYISPPIFRVLGYSPAELVGQDVLTLFHPDDHPHVRSKMARMRLEGATATAVEARALHRDGSLRWLQAVATNMLDEPSVSAVVANIRDITAQKSSVEELRVAELRYRRLTESGIFAVFVANLDGHTLEANDAFLALFGYTKEDLLAGVRRSDLPPALLEQLTDSGATSISELELRHKDGRSVPVLMGVAMLDADKCIGVIADLSERKRAEAALHKVENQLRQAQKMEAVGRLAGGVAHDFNNLLSVILTYSRFSSDALQPGDPIRDDIEEVIRAGQRAAELTKQLLMFSRQQVIEPKVLDLNDVLAGLDKMLQRILGEDVTLVFVAGAELGRVKADRSSIEQVIMNLVVNARDAMPTGGKLTIETANVVLDEHYALANDGIRPGPHVMLAVTDTGAGMDAATQARIFEPFFTTKDVGKGTGLGLSTVFGIVHQSGGSIYTYSEPGRGTTFKVYLPRTDLDVETRQVRAESDAGRGTETILLVEDEDQVRAVARSILQRFGYKVIEARNGGEAFLLCEKHPGTIHLLLTDVVMPQMSGPELAKRLSTLRPQMKLLCMSGYTNDSVVRHGVLNEEIAFVQKPLTPEALIPKLREVLDEG